MHTKTSFVVRLSVVLVIATFSVADADFMPWIVDDISQASYTNYLGNALYTNLGDDRGLGGSEHDLARDFIYDEFASFGLDTSLDPFLYNSSTYNNVVGVHLGATRPDDIYVLGAHYDSAGTPGADDNASGVAGVLEVARVLSQYEWEATMVFIGFDREEQGLFGSLNWANANSGQNIMGMVTLDMIAYEPEGDDWARLHGTAASDPLIGAVQSALTDYGGLAGQSMGALPLSDHWPFEQVGFDACMLSEYDLFDNPNYHLAVDSVDTPGYINYEFATNITRGAAGWMAEASVQTPEPGTLALLVIGMPVLGWVRRRRNSQRAA